MLLSFLFWYGIVTVSSVAVLGVIYIHDRIKYGPIPIEEDDA